MDLYKYSFERTDAELSAQVESNTPLPHIERGNHIHLSNKHLNQDGGALYEIQKVVVFASLLDNATSIRIHRITVSIAKAPEHSQ